MNINSVMIVDDNECDQFLTKEIVAELDSSITVFQAYDGEEALEKLEEMCEAPDVILLDINMPRMNGFDFLEEYNKRESNAKVVAMLTSSAQEKDKEKAKKYECVKEFFVKPIDAERLEELLNHYKVQ